jgi:hypothetical protein
VCAEYRAKPGEFTIYGQGGIVPPYVVSTSPNQSFFLLYLLLCPSACAADDRWPVVEIEMEFNNSGKRSSSGFLINKMGDPYVVFATHSLGLTDGRDPIKMILYDVQTKAKVGEVPELKDKKVWYRQHGEQAGEYVDVSAISLNRAGLKMDETLLRYSTSYEKLIQVPALSNAFVRLRSKYGEKTCSKVQPVYELDRGPDGIKIFHGIQYKDCSPEIRGGDSGGLVEILDNGTWLVAGINLQAPKPSGPYGFASDSQMIKETLDLF